MTTDYLVLGAGAAGMAFTDALIAESTRTAIIVDRRHAAGGHWHDAYPFVRLHQPSAFYGVNSLPLGEDRINDVGPNRGAYELASGSEILGYYDRAMQRLLETGRVQFLSRCEYDSADGAQHEVVSKLSGTRARIVVRHKLVDASYLQGPVPSTHRRNFEVGPDVQCVAINGLARLDAPAPRYVVLGSGKTAVDACLWLLAQGVEPGRIRWVRPRDAWFINRAYTQPGALVCTSFEGFVRQLEAAAGADHVDDLMRRLEAADQLLRIDPRVEPTMFRCATVNDCELRELRRITDVVRLGRVRHILRDHVILERGSVPAARDDLYVDCTANPFLAMPSKPIFERDRITLQAVRTCQPCFNSALIGHLEATREDLGEKNRLCPTNPYPSVPADWARMFVTTLAAQRLWSQDPGLEQWVERTRLNWMRGLREHRAEPAVADAMRRFRQNVEPAIDNLTKMSRGRPGDSFH
jgi:hypothetical protein